MSASACKRLGLGLIFTSVLVGLLLFAFGARLMTFESHTMPAGAKDGVSTMHIEFYWPMIVLLVTAIIGAVLAAQSRRGKTNG